MHAQQKCLTLGIKYDLLNEQTNSWEKKLYSILIISWQVLWLWILRVSSSRAQHNIRFTFIGLKSAMVGLQHREMGDNNLTKEKKTNIRTVLLMTESLEIPAPCERIREDSIWASARKTLYAIFLFFKFVYTYFVRVDPIFRSCPVILYWYTMTIFFFSYRDEQGSFILESCALTEYRTKWKNLFFKLKCNTISELINLRYRYLQYHEMFEFAK